MVYPLTAFSFYGSIFSALTLRPATAKYVVKRLVVVPVLSLVVLAAYDQ